MPNTRLDDLLRREAANIATFEALYGTAHARAGGHPRHEPVGPTRTCTTARPIVSRSFVIVPVPAAVLLGIMGLGAAARLRRKA